MFERSFQLGMKYAARILFAVALVFLGTGIIGAIYQFGRLGPGNEIRADWLLMWSMLITGASQSVMPFIGATALHRFDKVRTPPDKSSG